MRVRWRLSARGDLDRILEYIRSNSQSGAKYVHRRINERVGQLGRFPRIGRQTSLTDVYELVVGERRTSLFIGLRVARWRS